MAFDDHILAVGQSHHGLHIVGQRADIHERRVDGKDPDGTRLVEGRGARLRSDAPATIVNGPRFTELLLLQGRPIGEPVVKYGPFVMNSEPEIHQAFADYRAGRFGRWPWPKDDPVHDRDIDRFAQHADGTMDTPT